MNLSFNEKYLNALSYYRDNLIDESIKLFIDLYRNYNKNSDVMYNLARLFLEKKDLLNAKKVYIELISFDSSYTKAKFDLATIYLLEKDFFNGFRWYESRVEFENFFSPVKINFPTNINDLRDKKILIFCEQGFGDTIQFIRFIDFIHKKTKKVDILIQEPLLKLFKKIFPLYNFILSIEEKNFIYDYAFPLLSIPNILEDKLIINSSKYFIKNFTNNKFTNLIKRNRLNIGICWQGQFQNMRDKFRSIEFDIFKYIVPFDEKVQFYSLQKDIRVDDERIIDLGKYFNDFYDTACAIDCMDLIITVDTSIVHLAGAMGKKTILLLPYLPDWRWSLKDNNSYWYESITLMRQNEKLIWNDVILELKYLLKKRYSFSYSNIKEEILYVLELQKKGFDRRLINRYFKELVFLKDDFAELYIGLANSYLNINKNKKAIKSFEKALALNDKLYEVYYGLGNIYRYNSIEKAELYYEKALSLNPNFIEVINNLANIYQKQEKFNLAKELYERGLKINDKNPLILENYASILKDIKEYQKSKFYYEIALRLYPNAVTIHYNYGLLLVLLGEYKKGWKEYSWYVYREDFIEYYKDYKKEIWDGKISLNNKKVLIVCEQGFGDNLMMIRFTKSLKEKYPKVKILCLAFKELKKLFGTIEEIDNIYSFDEKVNDYDFYIPMMCFPTLLDISNQNIPYDKGYFELISKSKIVNKNKRIKVGFVWSGSNSHKSNANRNLTLEDFAILFENSFIDFYSLQLGEEVKKLKKIRYKNVYDCSDKIGNFYDTAKIISKLDLVITIDTSVAHLSCSLAKSTFVIIPYRGAFLWGIGEVKTPWYKSAKLFRIDKDNNIDNVFYRINKELEDLEIQT